MSSDKPTTRLSIDLSPIDNERLVRLCGQFDEHLAYVESRLSVDISHRGGHFQVCGAEPAAQHAVSVIKSLYDTQTPITREEIHLQIQESGARVDDQPNEELVVTRKVSIKPRGVNQRNYVNCIRSNDLNFGIGPAGTGKTYLAVACAVSALEKEQVQRLVLVRPAVEAGERLGFLPGDLAQKVDPYLRPIYDALYEMLGFDRVGKLMERNVIEVAPLAYMRGRTLNNAFVILDEAQNTTRQQMKMFLTRIGFGSTAVVTGDITQVDLPRHETSGLREAMRLLNSIEGISFTHFDARDVVRHPLVQRVIEAYERDEHPES